MANTPTGTFYCNEKHKVAYLAIRKCGCTSIARFIAGHKAEKVLQPIWRPEHAEVNFDLVTADESVLQDYFTFTIVRNPYDRLLSFYKNWVVNPPHGRLLNRFREFGIAENVAFDEFVKAFVTVPDLSILDGHTTPMWCYVFRDELLRVKFIGKLENVETDFSFVKAACSLEGDLPIANKSPSDKKLTNPYTPELRELVYNFYRRDFDLFGYDNQIEEEEEDTENEDTENDSVGT